VLRNEVLLSKDKLEQTAWHKAAKNSHVDIFEKLWEWAKELQLKPEDLKNVVLLSKDKYKETAWHKAVESGPVQILEKLWDWAKNCS
jgi:ankyrin repeat protein